MGKIISSLTSNWNLTFLLIINIGNQAKQIILRLWQISQNIIYAHNDFRITVVIRLAAVSYLMHDAIWIPQEADEETEFSVQRLIREGFWDPHLWKGEERSRSGQRKQSSLSAGPAASVNTTASSECEVDCQNHPHWPRWPGLLLLPLPSLGLGA